MPTMPGLPSGMPPDMGATGMPTLPPQGPMGAGPEPSLGNPGVNMPPPGMGPDLPVIPPQMMGVMAQPPELNDYNADDIDVLPVADPNMATDMQRMAKMQAVMQFAQLPGVNLIEGWNRATGNLLFHLK
jgi:hypothetical protein